MNVYIASSFTNKPAVRAAMDLVRAAGHAITHDWTAHEISQAGDVSVDTFLEACGVKDFFGIMKADVLILIAHADMRDALAEMGIALGAGKRVIVVDAEERHSVFYGLCERYSTIAAAVESIR